MKQTNMQTLKLKRLFRNKQFVNPLLNFLSWFFIKLGNFLLNNLIKFFF